jgi:aryl-alcohol dehydrogenase-like predicted oxidoreductase
MKVIADARGVSVARIALAYVLAKPFVTTVIIGAKTVEQLDDNLAAAEIELTAEEMSRRWTRPRPCRRSIRAGCWNGRAAVARPSPS